MAFAPVGDSWSRRSHRRQPVIWGVDLNNRRNTSLILLFGTVVSALLLTSRYHLAYPDDHPYGLPATIGKQAFEATFNSLGVESSKTGTGEMEGGFEEDYNSWGGMDSETAGESDSEDWLIPFQKNGWDPLKGNPTPITEITIKSCVLPPGLYDLCAPVSTKKEDATRGKWVRVDRDLNRRIGIYYLYLFTRRLLPNSPAPVITNITLLDHAPTSDDLTEGGMWTEVSETIRLGVWPKMTNMFLHYKVTEQSEVRAARKSSDSGKDAGELEPITELDVIYGGDEVQPLWGYEIVPTYITGGLDDKKRVKPESWLSGRVGSRIAVRRAVSPLPKTPSLTFSPEGNYTILQVADLHFSVGPGACRDMDPESEAACKRVGGDQYSLSWLKTAVEEVQPDLVVFSGDQLNGQDTSWSSQSAILKWAPVLWKKKIPYTVIFGNHDSELDLTRADQMTLLRSLPYFVGEAGPSGVDGVGNYYRAIQSYDSSNTTLLSLYFLDTHALASSLNPWEKGYDWLKASQINWFKGQSARVPTISRPYVAPYESIKTASKGKKPKPKTKNPSSKRPKKPSHKKPVVSTSDDSLTNYPTGDRRRQWGWGTAKEEVVDDEVETETEGDAETGADAEAEAEVELEAEAEAEAETEAAAETEGETEGGGTGWFSPAVEPDDGSNVQDYSTSSAEFSQDDDLGTVSSGDKFGTSSSQDDGDDAVESDGDGFYTVDHVAEENSEDGTTGEETEQESGDGEETGFGGQEGVTTTTTKWDTLTSEEGTTGEEVDPTKGDGSYGDLENGSSENSELTTEEEDGEATVVDAADGQAGDTTDGPMTGEVGENDSALSPFEDEYEESTPTLLPDGPTKNTPMQAKPNAITFFHIPLPESYEAPVDVGLDGSRLVVGERFEGSGAPKFNSGFFTEALVSQGELIVNGTSAPVDEFWEGEFSAPTTGRPEVKVVANGHNHISEDCRRVQGIWLCFGGGGSYSGYGRAGFARRMRVYSVSEYGERIETYKLLDTLERIDSVVLAGEGAMGSTSPNRAR